MKKEIRRDIHGISINALLKELWDIQMTQKIHGPAGFEWTEMLLVNHITEQYGIKNENGQFYIIIDRLFTANPLSPPFIDDILKECRKDDLMEDKDGN